jgi:GNAT superfamily N-acetyltransferase
MKTFKQFISEAKAPDSDALHTITKNYERRYPGMKFVVTRGNYGDLRVHSLEVPKHQRRQGIGSRAMKGLTKYADNTNKRITLSQQPEPRYKGKLQKFYSNFEFKPNKGRNKDFTVSDTHIRNPQSQNNTRNSNKNNN